MRRNMRLLANLLARAPIAALLAEISALRGDATPLGLAQAGARRKRPPSSISSKSSASISICSSASGAASCCPTARII